MSGLRWTRQEEAQLKANMDRFSAKQLAPLLDKTVYAVECKMAQMRKVQRVKDQVDEKKDVKIERLMELVEIVRRCS